VVSQQFRNLRKGCSSVELVSQSSTSEPDTLTEAPVMYRDIFYRPLHQRRVRFPNCCESSPQFLLKLLFTPNPPSLICYECNGPSVAGVSLTLTNTQNPAWMDKTSVCCVQTLVSYGSQDYKLTHAEYDDNPVGTSRAEQSEAASRRCPTVLWQSVTLIRLSAIVNQCFLSGVEDLVTAAQFLLSQEREPKQEHLDWFGNCRKTP
jgi:hypothetical protein